MTLFPTTVAKPKSRSKSRPTPRDRADRRLPSGTPRVVESSNDRSARASVETWQAMVDAVRRSASARLMLLDGRSGSERVPCSWEQITGCDVSCRCRGAGTVTVEFLRRHYEHLAVEIAMIASPAPAQRRSS